MSESAKIKIRISQTGKSNHRYGKKTSNETRMKLSKALSGEKNHFWKGGITSINKKIRGSLEYRIWRENVFERDNWTCVFCFKRGGRLNADHIKPFAYFPELRLDLNNGRTLCMACHRKTETFGKKVCN